ncbi:MAG: PD40 domain-containing protein, partial [Anaerolineales bacterium]|nr:PD40 domain-containing protein [Anaerolineales bacterium]
MAGAAAEWQEAGQDPGFLLRGTRLAQLADWAIETSIALTDSERSYLASCLAARQEREMVEATRQAREQGLEHRARTVLRVLAVVFFLAALISSGLAYYANQQRQDALRQASIGLAAQALVEIEGEDPERAVLLTLEALEHYPYTAQAESALAEAVEAYHSSYVLMDTGTSSAWFAAAWSPDAQYIVAGAAGELSIGHLPSRREILKASFSPQNQCWLVDVDWSPYGDRFVSIIEPSGVSTDDASCPAPTVWDMNSGEPLLAFAGHEAVTSSVAWLTDSESIVTGDIDGVLIAWNAQSGEQVRRRKIHAGPINDIVWSSQASAYATAGEDGVTRVWHMPTDDEIRTIPSSGSAANALAWSPDGKLLAVAGADGLVRLWDISSGKLEMVLIGHQKEVVEVDWSADGRRIATLSIDGHVRLWNARNGSLLYELPGSFSVGISKKIGFGFSPDGNHLVTNHEHELIIWDVSDDNLYLLGHAEFIRDGQWSPDGRKIVTSSHDGTTRIWDAATGDELVRIANEGFSLWLGWSPDSKYVVTTEGGGPAKVWDVTTGELLLVLPGPEGTWSSDASWSPDGTRIVVSFYQPQGYGHAIVFDANTGEQLQSAERGDGVCYVSTPSWNPESTLIVNG